MAVERRTLIRAGGLAMLLVASLGHAAALEWHRYVNTRYRYQLCYPSFLKAQPEAADGDGRIFRAADGAVLTVFGRNDILGTGIDAVAASTADDLAGPGGHTTYRAGRGNWRVVSGTDRTGAVFYARMLQRDDQFAIVHLKYPGKAALYRSIAARLGSCFAMLR